MHSHKIAMVVFDIAGTTVKDNGEIALAFQVAMDAFGYSVPAAEINALMGYKKTEAIRMLLEEYEPEREEITMALINSIHDAFLDEMIAYYTSGDITALPFAEEVFSRLKEKDIRVGLNTGFSNAITDVIMDRTGWLKNKQVDYVISSNEVEAGRPFPYMIEEMMKRAKIMDARAVIKVGDTSVDIWEGQNAGCLYSIGITTGAFTQEELEPFKPSFIINNLKELLPIVETAL